MQILLFAPGISPLAHIHMHVNNMAAQGWSNRGSVITAYSVRPILWEISLASRRQHTHASVGNVPVEYNNMADSASRLTHLTDRKFLSHFYTYFSKSKPWRPLLLSSRYKQQLNTMLHTKQSFRGSLPPSSRNTPPTCTNGSASADG